MDAKFWNGIAAAIIGTTLTALGWMVVSLYASNAALVKSHQELRERVTVNEAAMLTGFAKVNDDGAKLSGDLQRLLGRLEGGKP